MAEERICIYKETMPRENSYVHYECDKRHLTRQEAIDEMLEAYVNIHLKLHDEEGRRPTDNEWAGAMLDALLEEK